MLTNNAVLYILQTRVLKGYKTASRRRLRVLFSVLILLLIALGLSGCGAFLRDSPPAYAFIPGQGGCQRLDGAQREAFITGWAKEGNRYGMVKTPCGPAFLLNSALYVYFAGECTCLNEKYSNLR